MTEDSRSLIAHLLEKQKYDEALPILGDLLEKNPADQECRTYHLLVVRILVLRWTLSRVESGQLSDSRPRAAAILSNAEALRVIGQDLSALGIDVFNLGKRNDEYTLWAEEGRSDKQPIQQKTLFKTTARTILIRDDSAGGISKPLHFSSSEIHAAHVAQEKRRKTSDGVTDRHDLSSLLRVLGYHLDKKAADDFIIFWSRNWVKVVYDNKEENFTLLNLSEVAANMHLRRSTHRPAN